jgi:ribosomal subunit interface protein
MRIDVRGQTLNLTPALQAYVERRFTAALDRFGDRVTRLTVRLSDDNAMKGGVDKHCRVELAMPRRREMVVDERQPDMYAAIDVAAERTARALAREIERRRAKRTLSAELRESARTGVQRRAVPVAG